MPDTQEHTTEMTKLAQLALQQGNPELSQKILSWVGGIGPAPTLSEMLSLNLASGDTVDPDEDVVDPDAPFESPGEVEVQPGLDWLLAQEELALSKYIAELQASVARENTAAQTDIANINAASRAESDRLNAALQRELQAGRIDADKYLQQQDLIQRESEFSRNHALNLRAQIHQEKIDELDIEIRQASEYRAERLLHAELAANPADTVLYEFFKRGLGRPEELAGAGVGGTGVGAEGAQVANTLGGFLEGGTLSGEDFVAPPPAYSDEALQQLAESIFSGSEGAGYNPNLGGIGAFGARIRSPNEISRSEFLGMDPTELAILSSFLKGGIQTVPGDDASRVAINPDDYFKQLAESFIPTIGSAVSETTVQYV